MIVVGAGVIAFDTGDEIERHFGVGAVVKGASFKEVVLALDFSVLASEVPLAVLSHGFGGITVWMKFDISHGSETFSVHSFLHVLSDLPFTSWALRLVKEINLNLIVGCISRDSSEEGSSGGEFHIWY